MKKLLSLFLICAMLISVGQAQHNFQHNYRPGSGPTATRTSGWLTWADVNNLDDGLITTNNQGIDLIVMQRFATSDLANYDGYNLTQISFYMNEEYGYFYDEYGDLDMYTSYGNFTVQVYQGGSYTSGTVMNPGQLVASQTVSSINYEDWTTITLNTPITIDASQELWFGLSISGANGSLISFDSDYATTGKGALIYDYDDNTWYDANAYGLDFTVGNWGIRAYAEDPNNPGSGSDGGDIDFITWFIDDENNQEEITELTVPYNSDFEILPVVWNDDYFETADFNGVVYFNYYMDGNLIGTDYSDVVSINSGAGTFWYDNVILTAAEIASNNYYGTHEFCFEVYADSEWNELYEDDNTACITVTFENQNSSTNNYNINVLNGDGSVSPSGNVSVAEGGSQTFTITVPACNTLQDVLVDGVSVLSSVVNNTYTFTNVTSNHSFQAIYAATTYNITASADANGTITPQTSSVACGDNIMFTITPNAGYQIARVTDNTADVTANVINNTYTISNITADHNVYVTFTNNGGEGGGTAINDYTGTTLNIYPNPADNQLYIQANSTPNNIEIYDITGKIIMNIQPTDSQIVLNIENLRSGVYFVKAISNDQNFVSKFVKK